MNRLNQNQTVAYNKILLWLKNWDSHFYKLIGYAGTGKSYLLSHLLEHFPKNGKTCICSPTNKACKNLKEILQSQNTDIEIKTIASLLHIIPNQQPNQETGRIEFKQKENLNLEDKRPCDYDLIVIDEAFMMSKENFQLLLSSLGQFTKVLFVGDNEQLKPINEKESQVELLKCDYSKLTEVVRYDGEILKIASQIRNDSIYNKNLYKFSSSEDLSVVKLNNDKALRRLIASLDWENSKLLSYTNVNVTTYNQLIHNILYGENSEPYIVGEKLIAKSPIKRKSIDSNFDTVIIPNSEEIIIQEIIEEIFIDGWDLYGIKILDEYDNELTLIHPNSKPILDKYLSSFIQSKEWKKYYSLLSKFDDLQHSYALTVHKSQGSGWDNIILDLNSFYKCKTEKKNLQYTAVTRCKKRLYVL